MMTQLDGVIIKVHINERCSEGEGQTQDDDECHLAGIR